MAGELRVYRHEGGYAVFDADRMQVSRVYACQQSEDAPLPALRLNLQERRPP